MEELNIWDLDRVNIKLNPQFINRINMAIDNKYISKVSFIRGLCQENKLNFDFIKNIIKLSFKLFSPLGCWLAICKKLNIPKEILQSNIQSYKTSGGINFIELPILPIKITPVFDMLLAHNIGYGTVINPKKGRLPYFGYMQFDKFYRISYIRKIEEIFGKIKFKENYFENSTRPYCPPTLSSLFFKYYNLKIIDFNSEKARVPEIIYKKGKESMLAVLIALVIDEGHIDSTQITINLKNPLLIEDLHKICDNLSYSSKVTTSKKEYEKGYSRIHILRKGMKKFWRDYIKINKKYPIIDLGWKGEKIENSFNIYKRAIYKTKGNKNIIFEILKNEQLSVNQLSDRINMTRQGVRFHIQNLLKEGKIRLINSNELNWIYGIK